MAIIRENGRFRSCGDTACLGGSALILLFAVGCVSTDEPLFGGVDAPDLRPDDAVESTVQTSAPVMTGAQGSTSAATEGEPSQQVLQLAPVAAMPPAPLSPSASPPVSPPPGPPAPPPPPSLADPCGSAGLLLCDTFENETSGAFPALAPWLPELSGCGTHRVDESGVSVSGTKALLAVAGGYPECMLHAQLLQQPDEVYVRSWVRLGAEPELLENYMSLIELGAREAQDEPELRIGLRPAGGSLCASTPGLDVSVSGLQGGSATGCSGFAIEPERWYCLQAHVKRQARSLDYELSVDGTSVLSTAGVRLGPAWNDRNWYLKVGRAAYGESAAGSVWHDDVAVSQEPLPCGQ